MNKSKQKIKLRHAINTYSQQIKDLQDLMRETGDGALIWHIRNDILMLRAEVMKLQKQLID